MGYIYLYGQIMTTEHFLLEGDYPKADTNVEIKERHYLLGGETGTAAAVLTSLGCNVVLGGTHLGDENVNVIRDYFKDKSADTGKLYYEKGFQGVVDYMIIAGGTRTGLGRWRYLYSLKEPWYEQPDEEAVKNCTVVGADPYFGDKIVEYCRKYQKKYATIDCTYDSDMNRYCEVNVLSHEHLELTYPGQDYKELFRHYTENTEGLIIFTFGEKEIMFGRKGQEPKFFKPYPIRVVSTLGAGDSFKAGTIYALDQGMSDEDLVGFACATAGVACENYPIPLNPPTLEKIHEVQGRKR